MTNRLAVALTLAVLLAPAAALADWVNASYAEWQFSAMFPVAPTVQTASKTDSSGAVAATTHAFLSNDGRILCLAGVTDYARPFDTEQELLADRDNFVKNAQATVTASRRTTFTRPPKTRLPALEFAATSTDRIFKSIVIVEGQRTYQIVGVRRQNDAAAAASVDRCIAGFKLTQK